MKAKILIVEDERVVALDIEQQLAVLDYGVVGVADEGRDALRLVHEHRPDLVLMDIRIQGDVDGVDLAHELRARYEAAVVFLTGSADDVTLQRALRAEPYGYLLKPFELRTLEATLETALFRRRAERRAEALCRWLADVLRSIPQAVIATDCAGRVAFLNAEAEHLLALRLVDAMLRPLDEVLQLEASEGPLASARLANPTAALPRGEQRRVRGLRRSLSMARLNVEPPEEGAGLVVVLHPEE